MAEPKNEPLEPIPAPVPEPAPAPAPEPAPDEGELERLREDRDNLREERDRLKADRDRLQEELDRTKAELEEAREELARSKETVDKLTNGGNPPPANAGEDFAQLVKTLPNISDVGQVAWDRAFRELKAAHAAAYQNYINKRNTTNVR